MNRQSAAKREITAALGWAAAMLGLALLATSARRLGYIDQDAATRLFSSAIGLWLVRYGDRMPKTLVPVPACAGQARRVASWSMVLSGLAYAGLWALAPIPVAATAGTAVILTGVIVTLGYCLSLRGRGEAA